MGTLPVIIVWLHVLAAWHVRAVSGIQCERITVPACQGLGYNMTSMPNLVGHNSQADAENAILELLPILDSSCSKHARFLICASIFPLCSPDVPRPVAACKSLCETVKAECLADETLAPFWPKFIDCTVLPQPDKQELCMQVPQDELKFENVKPQPVWPWMPWKNSNVLRPLSQTICPNNYTAVDGRCGPQCGRDAMFTAQQKKIADTWTLALSAICFILTLFTLVTFWAEPMRFGYPERPVLFLALCYNLLSVSYLERVIFHNPLNTVHSECGTTPPCLVSFIVTSYLTLSAASWWLIFSMCWYLSTEKQWSSEALEKKAGLFHLIAWLPPIVPSIVAILWGAVQPNELTGMCTAYGFAEISGLTLLLVGAIFSVLASRSLHGLSITVNDNAFNRRLSQVRTRILVFGCVFFTPAFVAAVLGFFENTYVTIPACVFGDPCVAPKGGYTSIPTLLRMFFTLTGGSLAGIWVWSKKTCESYRSRIATGQSVHPTTTAATKSAQSMMQKKIKSIGPLYAGISFHNVPIYNSSAGA